MSLTIKNETWFTPREVAEWLGLTEQTLNKWRSAGQGPTYISTTNGTRGGRILYKETDIHNWLNSLEPQKNHPLTT